MDSRDRGVRRRAWARSCCCTGYATNRLVFENSYEEGLGVTEYEPDGPGTQDIEDLLNWICGKVRL